MADLLKTSLKFEGDFDPDSQLRDAVEAAFMDMAAEVTGRFNDAISGEYWPWPDSTPRFGSTGGSTVADAAKQWNAWLDGSGTAQGVAGSPRSIVDSGELKQSMNFQLDLAALEATWTWNADYAAAVHEGAYISPFGNPTKVVELPARPWTTAVLQGNTVASGIPVYDAPTRLQRLIEENSRDV